MSLFFVHKEIHMTPLQEAKKKAQHRSSTMIAVLHENLSQQMPTCKLLVVLAIQISKSRRFNCRDVGGTSDGIEDVCYLVAAELLGRSCGGAYGMCYLLHCLHRWVLGERCRCHGCYLGRRSSSRYLGCCCVFQHVCSDMRLPLPNADAMKPRALLKVQWACMQWPTC